MNITLYAIIKTFISCDIELRENLKQYTSKQNLSKNKIKFIIRIKKKEYLPFIFIRTNLEN